MPLNEGISRSLTIFGCGGIGLAAIMVAKSRGAKVIAVDISEKALAFAKAIGADCIIDVKTEDPIARIMSTTRFGAHISVDALGSIATAQQSIQSLRPRGHHLQIGLLPIPVIKDRATIPMHIAIGRWGVLRILDRFSSSQRISPWLNIEGSSHLNSKLR